MLQKSGNILINNIRISYYTILKYPAFYHWTQAIESRMNKDLNNWNAHQRSIPVIEVIIWFYHIDYNELQIIYMNYVKATAPATVRQLLLHKKPTDVKKFWKVMFWNYSVIRPQTAKFENFWKENGLTVDANATVAPPLLAVPIELEVPTSHISAAEDDSVAQLSSPSMQSVKPDMLIHLSIWTMMTYLVLIILLL